MRISSSLSQIRLERCTSGHCKERRRHGAQIIYQDSALNTNNLNVNQRKLDEAEKSRIWTRTVYKIDFEQPRNQAWSPVWATTRAWKQTHSRADGRDEGPGGGNPDGMASCGIDASQLPKPG